MRLVVDGGGADRGMRREGMGRICVMDEWWRREGVRGMGLIKWTVVSYLHASNEEVVEE